MSALLAVDWGTSSLRGALLDANGRVLGERHAPHGILSVPAGGFAQVYESMFGDWARQTPRALVCGMAGSRQGWREAPYCACPAGAAEIARAIVPAGHAAVEIVPGLSTEHAGVPDVMDGLTRDFESAVIGAALRHTHGRRIEAATRLGVGRNTITRKIQDLGLEH